MKHYWAELRPKLRNSLSDFEAMIVAPNTEEVLAQIEIHFPGATRRRRSSKSAEVYILRSGPTLRVFLRHRFAKNSALLRLFLDDAEVHDNPNAGALVTSTSPFFTNDETVEVDDGQACGSDASTSAFLTPRRLRRASFAADCHSVISASKYDIVLADPPWSYHGAQDGFGAAAKHYPTMTDKELLDFDLRERFMNNDSILFMWATGPRLDLAMDCIREWNLHYRGMAFVWVKTTKAGVPVGAQGVRPTIVKPTCEFVLAASVTKKGRPLNLHDESIRNTILAPKMEHSRKPDDVHERIERMYPQASKIELFARRARPGWDCWGNEAPAHADNDNMGAAKGVAA